MNPDELKQAWQAQASHTKLTIDPQLLLQEVRRNQRTFNKEIFHRDLLEIIVGVVLIPVWFILGIKGNLPWTWYLMVPSLIWIVGCFLVERIVHHRAPQPADSLKARVDHSLAEVEHQIRLLRNVFWWYMLPFILPAFAFVAHVAWLDRDLGWAGALALTFAASVIVAILAFVYAVNQRAVRISLEPRRLELEALRASLKDELPPPG